MKYLSLSLPNINPNEPSITIIPPDGIPTGGITGTGNNLISLTIQYVFIAGSALAVIFIIIAGIEWITSGGDEKKIEKARGRLTYAIVGLVVIVGAFFIINTVLALLGQTPSSLLHITWPTT